MSPKPIMYRDDHEFRQYEAVVSREGSAYAELDT
jgi:hypothetical protein